MSSKVHIEPTQFTNLRTGEVTQGIRVYDDHACAYDNTWISVSDDDLVVLATVIDICKDNDTIKAMLDFVQESETSIFIGGERYDWDQIKHLF